MEIKDLITDIELKECLELIEDNVANHDKENIEIKCINCGKTFIFTSGEREFYKSKNFEIPKRCKKCSKERRLKFLNYK